MAKDQNLISLKDAAKVTGYSADYIGQLIRAGKIPGKQVYCNVAWMTTAEDVLSYKEQSENKNDKKGGFFSYLKVKKRRLAMELGVFRLFFDTFRSALPALVTVFVAFLLLSLFFVYLVFDKKIVNSQVPKVKAELQY